MPNEVDSVDNLASDAIDDREIFDTIHAEFDSVLVEGIGYEIFIM